MSDPAKPETVTQAASASRTPGQRLLGHAAMIRSGALTAGQDEVWFADSLDQIASDFEAQRVSDAAEMRRLRGALAVAITYVELTCDEESGEEQAEAKHDLDACRAALQGGAA
jgi:hypothetical protein